MADKGERSSSESGRGSRNAGTTISWRDGGREFAGVEGGGWSLYHRSRCDCNSAPIFNFAGLGIADGIGGRNGRTSRNRRLI